jgi:hypothetical protein
MHGGTMTERIIFTNLFALIIAAAACLIAHVAGIKYYVRRKENTTLVPAIVSTVEAVILMVVAIVLVQLK